MSLEWYKTSLKNRGATRRDRVINNLVRDINMFAPENPAYKSISFKNEIRCVIVNSTDDMDVKEFISMPGEYLPLGLQFFYANTPWLVTEKDVDDEIYGRCEAKHCNVSLKWENDSGDILEYYGIAEDATKYSEGVASTQYISVDEFQIKVILPLDSNTSVIWRDMRFLIDANNYIADIEANGECPFAFRVTRRNVVTGTYENEGYVEITMVEDTFRKNEDDHINMIASQRNTKLDEGTSHDGDGLDVEYESKWL